MVVFEIVTSKDTNRTFKREIREKLNDLSAEAQEERQEKEQVAAFGGSAEFKLSILYQTVYFGCVTDSDYNDDKVYRFLEDLKAEMTKMYKGNLSFILK
jgi:hypothetical protein